MNYKKLAGLDNWGQFISIGVVLLLGIGIILPSVIALGVETSERCDTEMPIQGVWYIGWHRESYASSSVDRDLEVIKQGLCAEYIALLANIYQDDKYSNDPHVDGRTVDDSTLAAVVKKVHDLGMKVVLLNTIKPDDGTWEGAILPEDLDTWFEHWEKVLVHYAKFSEKHGVEVFLLGSELPTLRGEPRRWKEIISEVRKYYSGKISFSVNFWKNRAEYEEVLNMTQWEDLDYIGITGYFELTPDLDPSVSQLRQAWSSDLHGQNVLEDIKLLRDVYNKPVVFWEIGYQSKDGTNIYPWDYNREAEKDEGEQKDSWIAFLRVIQDKDWILGYMAFGEQVGLPEEKPGYNGYNVIRKKAQTVFCNICKLTGQE